jgi:C4-dicarboxylate-specific signal transduction histidine kinase
VPEEERLVSVTVTTTADTVSITIADSGPGIDPFVRDKIFTPFFTTKNSGEGIGLGLAIVDNIARSLHGGISVTDREPRGTSFTLSLPRAGGDRNET